MKYPYIVNKNGIWYPSGTDVPEGKPSNNVQTEEKKKETATEYSKTDINRMSTAELKELAINVGIEDAENIKGADLKKILIEKFGL